MGDRAPPPQTSLVAPWPSPSSFVILGLDPRIQTQACRLTNTHPPAHPARMAGYVYIVTNHKHGTLYIGVTSDLARRIYEHREGLTPGFTSKYGLTQLVWYEEHWDIRDAIQREKTMKQWYRKWKIALIEERNPDWRDLYLELW
ncbi:endonuclease [Pseudorhizobium halotolerans]|uniref:Endonuclease n=2 Tax=Pseudorhizobium halotolerans TaxID=1233081 RepID=A0ABN7JNZ5_9HYPH|nr:endonuclease [Pseudorhizobium halotolerans]